jgi:hypothetical protein
VPGFDAWSPTDHWRTPSKRSPAGALFTPPLSTFTPPLFTFTPFMFTFTHVFFHIHTTTVNIHTTACNDSPKTDARVLLFTPSLFTPMATQTVGEWALRLQMRKGCRSRASPSHRFVHTHLPICPIKAVPLTGASCPPPPLQVGGASPSRGGSVHGWRVGRGQRAQARIRDSGQHRRGGCGCAHGGEAGGSGAMGSGWGGGGGRAHATLSRRPAPPASVSRFGPAAAHPHPAFAHADHQAGAPLGTVLDARPSGACLSYKNRTRQPSRIKRSKRQE